MVVIIMWHARILTLRTASDKPGFLPCPPESFCLHVARSDPSLTYQPKRGPMENVVLIIHLLLALSLIGVVLMQRSEGGGLGMGSSGPNTAGRAAATALSKVTWVLAAGFICTSIFLTVLAAQNAAGTSVIDRAGVPAADGTAAPATPALPSADDLLPPASDDDAPLVPKAD